MREIRIKNVQDLFCVVIGLKSKCNFLIGKKLYEYLDDNATTSKNLEMIFTTKYGDVSIAIVVKFNYFCKAYYRLESVAVENNLVYGYSQYVDNSKEQVVIDAE